MAPELERRIAELLTYHRSSGLCPLDGPCTSCDCFDPQHEYERAHAKVIVGEIVSPEIERLTAERDRARDAAVALEQQLAEMDVAAVRAISAEAKAVREAEAKLQAIKQLRTWKNEDGQWFVFVDDLHEAMRGEH